MPRDAEVALARSAAPPVIADRATVKVLTASGYEVARQGDNGVVCMVMRGFTAPTYTPAAFRAIVYDPTIHAPICFAAPAVRTVLPYYELRTKLAIAGKHPDQIAEALQAAYVKGELPRRDGATFAYMFSAHQHLGPGIGAWHPHMMVFVPYADATTVGATPFGEPLPTGHRRRRHAVRRRRDPGRREAVRETSDELSRGLSARAEPPAAAR